MLSTASNEGAGADKTITGTLNNPVMYCGAWDRRTDVMSSGDLDISVSRADDGPEWGGSLPDERESAVRAAVSLGGRCGAIVCACGVPIRRTPTTWWPRRSSWRGDGSTTCPRILDRGSWASLGTSLANRRRSVRRLLSLSDRLARDAEAGRSASADDGTAATDLRLAVLAALDRLPDKEQEAIRLLAWDRLSAADAATVLGCTRATLAVRVHRARRRLATLLEPERDAPTVGSDPSGHPVRIVEER